MLTTKDSEMLKHHAIELALMMENEEIDQVIADLVEVKNIRRQSRRGT